MPILAHLRPYQIPNEINNVHTICSVQCASFVHAKEEEEHYDVFEPHLLETIIQYSMHDGRLESHVGTYQTVQFLPYLHPSTCTHAENHTARKSSQRGLTRQWRPLEAASWGSKQALSLGLTSQRSASQPIRNLIDEFPPVVDVEPEVVRTLDLLKG